MQAGETLKDIRNRLGITIREVEEHSRRIAEAEANPEFCISNGWITQLENTDASPSIYKLFSLSVIYRTKFTDLLLLFGVDLERISSHQLNRQLARTHLTNLHVYDSEKPVTFPIRFDRGFRVEKTNLLARMIEVWGEVPISFIQHLDVRRGQYGYIGLADYTLYPILRPGSFVQIDPRLKRVQMFGWRTEWERPIYFVELREGYACAWCELRESQLTLLPHPLSPCHIRQYAYPSEAEIVGQVTAVAMRIVSSPELLPGETPRLPRRS